MLVHSRLVVVVALLAACGPPAVVADTPPPAAPEPAAPTTGVGFAGTDTTPSAGLSAVIAAPNGDGSFLNTEVVRFTARFTNAGTQSVVPESVSWASDLMPNPLGTTNPVDTVLASLGVHTVTVTGKALGLSVLTSVKVRSVDPASTLGVRFTRPLAEDVFVLTSQQLAAGIPFSLDIVGAPAVTPIALSYTWTTSNSAALEVVGLAAGGNNRVQGSLRAAGGMPPPAGSYDLQVSVSEASSGRTGTASVHIIVLTANTPPAVAIVTPASSPPLNGALVSLGANVSLTGTVSDADAGRSVLPDIDLVGTWKDSLLGKLGTGGSASLSVGQQAAKREITFCATDKAGAESCARRAIYVSASSDPAAALAALFPSVNEATLGLNAAKSGVNVFYTDALGRLWVGNDRGFSVLDSTGSVLQLSGLPQTLGPPNSSTPNPQVAAFNDIVVIGGQTFFATSKGLFRCDVSAASAAALTFANCAALQEPGTNAQPDAYTATAKTRAFALQGGKLYAVSDSGVAVVSAPSGAPAVVDVFYARTNAFTPDRAVVDIAFVGDAPWLVLADAVGNGNRALCVPVSASGAADPFTGANSDVTCGNGPVALTSLMAANATTLLTTVEAGHTIVYLGTQAGLLRWDSQTQLAVGFDKDSGLAGDQVTALALRNGIVWVGTTSGLSRLDPTTGLITNFDRQDFGAGTSNVSALGVDATGALWLQMGDANPAVFRYTGS